MCVLGEREKKKIKRKSNKPLLLPDRDCFDLRWLSLLPARFVGGEKSQLIFKPYRARSTIVCILTNIDMLQQRQSPSQPSSTLHQLVTRTDYLRKLRAELVRTDTQPGQPRAVLAEPLGDSRPAFGCERHDLHIRLQQHQHQQEK